MPISAGLPVAAPRSVLGIPWRGARRPAQPTHRRNLRRQPASAALRAPVVAPAKFGSIPPARFTIAPVLAGTARPSKAATCPKRRQGRRVLGRTTEKFAAHNTGRTGSARLVLRILLLHRLVGGRRAPSRGGTRYRTMRADRWRGVPHIGPWARPTRKAGIGPAACERHEPDHRKPEPAAPYMHV